MKRTPLLILLLLLALGLGCTPRGGRSRGNNNGGDEPTSDDDDATTDADDDDATGAGYDGDDYGQMELSVALDGGGPTVLCSSDLWIEVQSSTLQSTVFCDFGLLIEVNLNGAVNSQGDITGTAYIDMSQAEVPNTEADLTGDIAGGIANVAFEAEVDGGDGTLLPMFGEGEATRE